MGKASHKADESVVTKSRDKKKLKRPKRYKVLLHDDNFTTMDFVVDVLMRVFKHDRNTAERLMLQVHRTGLAVGGVYTFEIAETRVVQVTNIAEKAGFPFLCTMEPE